MNTSLKEQIEEQLVKQNVIVMNIANLFYGSGPTMCSGGQRTGDCG